jgi:hypothetical protein
MRTGSLVCAAIAGAALIGPRPSMAQSTDTTPQSGVEVEAKRVPPTALSGIDVVVKRATRLSEVEVSVPLCPPVKKTARSADRGVPTGNNIVVSEGRFDDTPPPKVVSSFPAKGQMVRPGLLVLRVTFDRPMTCIGLLHNHAPLPDPCPAPLQAPMVSRDKRTFLTVCMIEANRQYGLWFNNFSSVGGQALPPYELVFDTSNKTDITTVQEALAEDAWLKPR